MPNDWSTLYFNIRNNGRCNRHLKQWLTWEHSLWLQDISQEKLEKLLRKLLGTSVKIGPKENFCIKPPSQSVHIKTTFVRRTQPQFCFEDLRIVLHALWKYQISKNEYCTKRHSHCMYNIAKYHETCWCWWWCYIALLDGVVAVGGGPGVPNYSGVPF